MAGGDPPAVRCLRFDTDGVGEPRASSPPSRQSPETGELPGLVALCARLARNIAREADGCAPPGLGRRHGLILGIIANRERTTSGELAREIGHDRGAMTRLIDDLQARGLLRRQRAVDDRRNVWLTLTPDGLSIALAFAKRLDERLAGLLGTWRTDEFNEFRRGLYRMEEALMPETFDRER